MSLTSLQTAASPAERTPRWREREGTAGWWWTSWSSWGTRPGSWERPSIWQREITRCLSFWTQLCKNIHRQICSKPGPRISRNALFFMRTVSLSHLLGDLENSQKSQRPQHTDAKWHARPEEAPNHLEDAADDDLQNMLNSRKDDLIQTQDIQITSNSNLRLFFSLIARKIN